MRRLLLALALCLCAAARAELPVGLDVMGGVAQASRPADGTWWESKAGPLAFHGTSPSWGAGLWGDMTTWARWEVAYEDLGTQTGSAAAYNGTPYISHWYGDQHPRTVCGTVEPRYWRVFLQLGVCGFQVRFTMHAPDFYWGPPAPGAPVGGSRLNMVVGNSTWYAGYKAGVGVTWGNVDVLLNNRMLKAQDANDPRTGLQTSWQGYSHSAWGLSVRIRVR